MPLHIADGAPLAPLNTFRVAASARRLVTVDAAGDLEAALDACAAPPTLVLGGGSNVLLTADIDAPVLALRLRGRRVVDADADTALVEAAAGEPWDEFVRWSLSQKLCGLQNLALIPGTVGAAPIQNVGAYGVELADCFDSLDAIDARSGSRRRFDAADCRFGYRDSVFKTAEGRRWLIVAVRMRLSRHPRLQLDYGEIRAELSRRGAAAPSPLDVAEAVAAIRRRKLPDPAVIGNAGSFFKNPVVPLTQAESLAQRHPELPMFPAGDREPGAARCKLPAAWLIERCGWKGHRQGDAGVHREHALVLVNHGNATGRELLALSMRIRESVLDRFGVALEPEPRIVPEEVPA